MILSPAEIESLIRRAISDPSKANTNALGRMLSGLRNGERNSTRTVLGELCAIGTAYGWREFEKSTRAELLKQTSPKARASARRDLQRTLEWITRACFELEWTSFNLATEALGLASRRSSVTRQRFLGRNPCRRLFALFETFPVLAALWSAAIEQWRNHVAEILVRADADRRAIARGLFEGKAASRIVNLHLGLSDRHLGGRSVALVEFEGGGVIYKPRPGNSESAWTDILRSMNRHGFKPRFKEPRILRRAGYHWMELIPADSCPSAAAVRRFYQRLGGLIAAAHLLNAIDCHRENLIASGEHPVLVDLDALCHLSPADGSLSATARLCRTGFFPNENPESLQSRSSVLGGAGPGTHVATRAGRRESAAAYSKEIIAGFRNGWHCLAGTPRRRAALSRRLRRIRSQKRRCIYGATATYAAIIHASLRPSALRSAAARRALVRRLAGRYSTSAAVLPEEIRALEQLDVPYFSGRPNGPMLKLSKSPPAELVRTLRMMLQIRPAGRNSGQLRQRL